MAKYKDCKPKVCVYAAMRPGAASTLAACLLMTPVWRYTAGVYRRQHGDGSVSGGTGRQRGGQ